MPAISTLIDDLVRDVRTIPVKFGDETLNVTFHPSAMTPATEERANKFLASGSYGNGYAELLATSLVAWDLTDDAGNVLPITSEQEARDADGNPILGEDGKPITIQVNHLRSYPNAILAAIVNAITADMRVGGKETRKNSGDTSPRKAR